MPIEVRSDYHIALRVLDPDGKVHNVGSHTYNQTADDWAEPRPIPHLQRLDPTGRWLASFDIRRNRIELRDVSPTQPSQRTFYLGLRGLEGDVIQFRWLESMAGLVAATPSNVYLLPFDPDLGTGDVEALAVFDRKNLAASEFIVDTRVLPDGLMVRTDLLAPEGYSERRGQVYSIKIADDTS